MRTGSSSPRSAGDTDEPLGIGFFLVARDAPGLVVERFRAIDGHAHCRLRLDRTPAIALGELEHALPTVEAAVDRALAAQAAESTGSMDAAADATLDYLRTREQFGVPIGGFQALQHRMVDMTMACEEARSMTYHATLHLGAAPWRRRLQRRPHRQPPPTETDDAEPGP